METNAPHAAIVEGNHLYDVLSNLRQMFRNGERPDEVNTALGVHGVHYGEEYGEEYAIVGLVFPDDVYAEIEDGTYGTLNGVRIFLGEGD